MDKRFIIIVVAAIIFAVVGGYMYSEKQKEKNSISISIGDKTISATVD